MYQSSLRHIHDPVFLPLKVEVICLSHLPYGVMNRLLRCPRPEASRGVKARSMFFLKNPASINSLCVIRHCVITLAGWSVLITDESQRNFHYIVCVTEESSTGLVRLQAG